MKKSEAFVKAVRGRHNESGLSNVSEREKERHEMKPWI